MRSNRTKFLACVVYLAAAFPAVAREDPSRDPIDLEAVKKASLVPFCTYMTQKKSHIKNWKKDTLPTNAELHALIRRNPSIEKELNRIRSEFYREIEADEKKRNTFRKKRTELKKY